MTATSHWSTPLLWTSTGSHHVRHPWVASCSASRRNPSHTRCLHSTAQLCRYTPEESHAMLWPVTWFSASIQMHPTYPRQKHTSKLTDFLFVNKQQHTSHQWSTACTQQHHVLHPCLSHRSWGQGPFPQCTRWQDAQHNPNEHGASPTSNTHSDWQQSCWGQHQWLCKTAKIQGIQHAILLGLQSCQGDFWIHWKKCSKNLVDYFTKHHALAHHKKVHPIYLHTPALANHLSTPCEGVLMTTSTPSSGIT